MSKLAAGITAVAGAGATFGERFHQATLSSATMGWGMHIGGSSAIGAGIGAVVGGLSDNSSMGSGAMTGAMWGAGYGVAGKFATNMYSKGAHSQGAAFNNVATPGSSFKFGYYTSK